MVAGYQNLLDRTKAFALSVLDAAEALPRTEAHRVMQRQLLRSATSVAANYRAAARARSRAEFISKLHIVEEEADESIFWIELVEARLPARRERTATPSDVWPRLRQEAHEILAIVVASKNTARRNTPPR